MQGQGLEPVVAGCAVLVVPFGPYPDPDTGCPATSPNPKKAARFVEAVCREIGQRAGGFRGVELDTVWLGGGATRLSLDSLYRVLQVLYDNFSSRLAAQAITVVPGTVDAGRAKVLAESGFDRAVLFVTDPDRERGDFELLRSASFRAIEVALPFSPDGREWERRLDAILSLGPDCLRCWLPARFDELTMLGIVRRTAERLASQGYERIGLHYYARPGKAAQRYPGRPGQARLVGFGPAAPTIGDREAWFNRPEFDGYVRQALAGEAVLLPASPRRLVELFLPFGLEAKLIQPGKVRELVQRGLLERQDELVQVTAQGAVRYREVVSELVRSWQGSN